MQEGMKVKIKVDRILKRRNELSSNYISFIKESKDKVFTLQKYRDNSTLWELKENPIWLFHEYDLEIIQNKEQYMKYNPKGLRIKLKNPDNIHESGYGVLDSIRNNPNKFNYRIQFGDYWDYFKRDAFEFVEEDVNNILDELNDKITSLINVKIQYMNLFNKE